MPDRYINPAPPEFVNTITSQVRHVRASLDGRLGNGEVEALGRSTHNSVNALHELEQGMRVSDIQAEATCPVCSAAGWAASGDWSVTTTCSACPFLGNSYAQAMPWRPAPRTA